MKRYRCSMGSVLLKYLMQQVGLQRQKYDAIICLGAVIKGDTPHNEYIASEAAKGIAQTGLSSGIPTILEF